MKWLTIILSLYLLGLSVWPCADEFLSLAGEERGAVSIASDASRSGTSHQDHDQCTPFCTCACCAVTITVAPALSYALTTSVGMGKVTVARFTYEPMHWVDPLTAIWQPPKLRA